MKLNCTCLDLGFGQVGNVRGSGVHMHAMILMV